jgi:hypothetical protein
LHPLLPNFRFFPYFHFWIKSPLKKSIAKKFLNKARKKAEAALNDIQAEIGKQNQNSAPHYQQNAFYPAQWHQQQQYHAPPNLHGPLVQPQHQKSHSSPQGQVQGYVCVMRVKQSPITKISPLHIKVVFTTGFPARSTALYLTVPEEVGVRKNLSKKCGREYVSAAT